MLLDAGIGLAAACFRGAPVVSSHALDINALDIILGECVVGISLSHIG